MMFDKQTSIDYEGFSLYKKCRFLDPIVLLGTVLAHRPTQWCQHAALTALLQCSPLECNEYQRLVQYLVLVLKLYSST